MSDPPRIGGVPVSRDPSVLPPTAVTDERGTESPRDYFVPTTVVRTVLPRLERGEIRVRVPFRPGRYDAHFDLLVDRLIYQVHRGNAEITFRFSQGNITQFRASFNPPWLLKVLGITVGCVRGIYLETDPRDPSRRGRVFADVDLFGNWDLDIVDLIVRDREITRMFLRALDIPGERGRMPMTLQALADSLLNRPPRRPQRQRAGPAEPEPIDIDGLTVVRGEVEVQPGTVEIGPLEAEVERGANGNGNRFTLFNSDLHHVHLGPLHLGRLRLNRSSGHPALTVNQYDQGGISADIEGDGEGITLRGGAGSIGSVEGITGLATFQQPTGASWRGFDADINPGTGAFRARATGISVPHLSGELPGGIASFDIRDIEGDAFLRRSLRPGREILETGLLNASLHVQSAGIYTRNAEIELGESDWSHAGLGAIVSRGLDPSGNIIEGSLQFQPLIDFETPRLTIRHGRIDLASLIRGGGGPVEILPSSLGQLRFSLDGDTVTARSGAVDLLLREMQFQFGRQVERRMRFPLQTDLILRGAYLRGPVRYFHVSNLFDRNPGGMSIAAEGDLELTSIGSGYFESHDPVNQFRLHTGEMSVSSHIERVLIRGGQMLQLEAGETKLDLREVTGQVVGFRTLEIDPGPGEANVYLQHVSVDLSDYRRQTEATGQPVTLATLTGLNLFLRATSNNTRLHFAPSLHGPRSHEGDYHLSPRRPIYVEISQIGETASILLDPPSADLPDGQTRLLFQGGRILAQVRTQP